MDPPEELLNHLNMQNWTDHMKEAFWNASAKYFSEMRINYTDTFEEEGAYCSGGIRAVLGAYRGVHGYLSLVVCVLGTVANALNVAVLTRKEMVNQCINRILTAMAVADMLVMLEYVPVACYMYIHLPDAKDFPHGWALFLLFHMHFSLVLHSISVCLTLTLAFWRYIYIKYPDRCRVLCTPRRCYLAIATCYVLPPFICSPPYLVFSVQATDIVENGQPVTLYHVGPTETARMHGEFLFRLNFWVYSVVLRLLPCLLLTVLSCWLVKELYTSNKRKRKLKGTDEKSQSEKRANRTTRMLIAVLLLFLTTEFLSGILGLLSGILDRRFFLQCYDLFGEVMDILALINGAINFILYCAMSKQFRTAFGELFKPRVLTKLTTPSQTEVQSTYV